MIAPLRSVNGVTLPDPDPIDPHCVILEEPAA